MTIIVYSKKHKILAADTQRSSSTNCIEGYGARKLGVFKSRKEDIHTIGGASGVLSAVTKWLDWLEGKKGIPPVFDSEEHISYIKVKYDVFNDVEEVYFGEKTLVDMQDNDEIFYCEGSGAKIALGALDAGATPIEAVKIAKKRDVYCGGRTSFINLRELYKGVQYVD